ncbi:MAG: Coenzyme F420 hydrogenase/dehydrogenase, beta subunit C-terminal domain, partial [Bacteroidales bacterium]|nr:Coenzyme F420 hydrogenase/dehydrogenase, beta subunit C-terminal domain [Bacteroidales bacterium]
FRHSCDVCHFSNLRRPSDITIADFWGWEKVDKTFNSDDRGVSLVLVNTSKGRHLFDEVKSCMNYLASDTQSCLQYNLQHPSQALPFRDKFERDYIKHGFVYVMKHYGNIGWRYKWEVLKRKCRTAKRLLFRK